MKLVGPVDASSASVWNVTPWALSEDIEFLRVAVPAGIKGEDVLFEHSLKQAEDMVSVPQDQPILRSIPGEDFETELFIKTSRCLEVFDG